MTTVTTSGIWTGVSHDLSRLQGLNTKDVFWGVGTRPSEQSGYRFEGVSAAPVPLDGTEFKLGTFTHLNRPLIELGARRFQVFLKLTLSFDQGAPSQDFNFTFDHYETPNRGSPPADEVTLPSPRSQETVTLAGSDYALQIAGFHQDGNLVTKFDSPEGRSNSADIMATLVAVAAEQPLPVPSLPEAAPVSAPLPAAQPPAAALGVPEDPCRVKNVVDTGSLFALALERLNRRSVVYLLEQLIAAVNVHCEKTAVPPGECVSPIDLDKLRNELLIAIAELRQSSSLYTDEANSLKQQIANLVVSLPQKIEQTIHNVNIEHVTNQIEVLNNKLIIIQKAAQELDGDELKQVEILLVNLLQNIDFGSVVKNVSIAIGGRRFDLWRVIELLATADRVASVHILYGDPDPWEIAGARFVTTDLTSIFFTARLLPDPAGLRVIYLFETKDWKGLPAQFKLVFLARKNSYTILGNKLNVDSFDGVEHTNVVFDLCAQLGEPSVGVSAAP